MYKESRSILAQYERFLREVEPLLYQATVRGSELFVTRGVRAAVAGNSSLK